MITECITSGNIDTEGHVAAQQLYYTGTKYLQIKMFI